MTDTTTSPPVLQPEHEKEPRARRDVPLLPLGIAAAVVVGLVLVYTLGGKESGLVTQSIATGLLLGGVYALVSVGLTLIFGVLGIVNFAQGAMLTLSMYLVYELVTGAGSRCTSPRCWRSR